MKQEITHSRRSSGSQPARSWHGPLILAAGILAMWLVVPGARGDVTFTTLVSFAGTNGSIPYAGLVQASDSNFYGTTWFGGTNANVGTVFRMTTNWALTMLISFKNDTNGGHPWAGLVQGRDGNLYGSTQSGGASGFGTVFKMTTNGALTTLVSFAQTNGSTPYAPLVQGTDGNFYGATSIGGTSDSGTVFKLTTNGVLTTLVSFAQNNGWEPSGALAQGADGNFYGTTQIGGTNGAGTVFEVTTNGTLTSLYSFTAVDLGTSTNTDGANPYAGLVQGAGANFYGTTYNGGTSSYGTVFTVATNGTVISLYSFTGGTDGANPWAGLVRGPDGSFYGTTVNGGTNGLGTVFQMTPNGALTSLYSFTGGDDGANPYAGLVLGKDGDFYGTTSGGGAGGGGTIFRLRVPMVPVFQPVKKAGSTLTLTWSAVPGLTYQLQYNTNLAKTNWFSLGTTNTATNNTMSAMDSVGPDRQRFYRVVLLP